VAEGAYQAGIHCYNSYNTACHAVGVLAYSVRQTSDGGCVLAGATNLKTSYGAPMVPWLAKTDTSGNLLWQHVYYQAYPSTGATLSQYFASSDLTLSGCHLALGFTTNPDDSIGELFSPSTTQSTSSSSTPGQC
jgi:hypothetical protein